MSYLAQFADAGLTVEPTTSDAIRDEEVARLEKLLAMAQLTHMVPRRLGGEATDEQLSADKKTARRVWHVAEQCLSSWSGKKEVKGAAVTEELKAEASQIEWLPWYQEHQVWLQNRIRFIATWACYAGGDQAFAKKAVVRLQNESNWLLYSLREAEAA